MHTKEINMTHDLVWHSCSHWMKFWSQWMLHLKWLRASSRPFPSLYHGPHCFRITVLWKSKAWKWFSGQGLGWVSGMIGTSLNYLLLKTWRKLWLYFFHIIYLLICLCSASGMEPMYWSSFMTSSMQLAKECLSQRLTDDLGESFQPLEGLEKFAETIETGTEFCSRCVPECQHMYYQ